MSDNVMLKQVLARYCFKNKKPGQSRVFGAVEKTRTSTGCPTATSTLRVYQFRHDRIVVGQIAPARLHVAKAFGGHKSDMSVFLNSFTARPIELVRMRRKRLTCLNSRPNSAICGQPVGTQVFHICGRRGAQRTAICFAPNFLIKCFPFKALRPSAGGSATASCHMKRP